MLKGPSSCATQSKETINKSRTGDACSGHERVRHRLSIRDDIKTIRSKPIHKLGIFRGTDDQSSIMKLPKPIHAKLSVAAKGEYLICRITNRQGKASALPMIMSKHNAPTSSAMMTGRLPKHSGTIFGLLPGQGDFGLPPWAYTLAERFSDAGCVAAIYGKWHLRDVDGRLDPMKLTERDHEHADHDPAFSPGGCKQNAVIPCSAQRNDQEKIAREYLSR